jgi:hypothetical protein
MWQIITAVVGGGLLLHKFIKGQREENFSKGEIFKKDGEKLENRRIYICHSYDDSASYNKLIRKLKTTDNRKVYDHSIPVSKKRNIVDNNELRAIFKQQMAGCSHVFVLASSDIPRKSYVKTELEVAKELGKVIIAVTDKDQYSIPPFIKKLADETVTNDKRNLKKQLKK